MDLICYIFLDRLARKMKEVGIDAPTHEYSTYFFKLIRVNRQFILTCFLKTSSIIRSYIAYSSRITYQPDYEF